MIETGPKAGRIDKRSDPMLSHLSDAVGYYVADKFPVPKELVSDEEFVPMT